MGGNLAASTESVLYNTDVDVTIVGDGEIAFKELADYVSEYGRKFIPDKLKQIQGLAFVDNEGELVFY